MCRHLAYIGDPRPLADLLYTPVHSLCHQSFAPKDMRRGGSINADGFGVAWHTGDTVIQYRQPMPMWNDTNLPQLAATTTSGGVVAAVRSASPGMPISQGACAPFTDGQWLFSLNGRIQGWPDTASALADKLPVTDIMKLDAPTDSAFLWALLRHRLRDNVDPSEVVRGVLADLVEAAPDSRLNLLLTDGTQAVATTWTHALSVLREPSGVTIASEPLDDGNWLAIGDAKLVTANKNTVEVADLNI